MVLENSSFHMRKNFFETYLKFGFLYSVALKCSYGYVLPTGRLDASPRFPYHTPRGVQKLVHVYVHTHTHTHVRTNTHT